jgi:diaminohydroxyphosphoribosylaminopyrimidine deaminase/5-amino-6-(5-phosphoribosylamino)uracil reductase
MVRALELARSVRGSTSPNPWVGAVAVRDGVVVGTGATAPPGGSHAEAAALRAAQGQRIDELYVTLEPCAPFPGKRTPACADALIDAGVRRVVVALQDVDERTAGRGLARLSEAGVEVELGDGREAAIELLRPYLKHRQTGTPYVIAKFAASLDGRIATSAGESQWITGEAARERVHTERAWVDAVLVGSGTVLADDPALTARPGGEAAERQPVRVVVDARGRTPPGSRVLSLPGAIVATTVAAPKDWIAALSSTGAQVLECEAGTGGVNLHQLLAVLGARGVLSVWAEGGPTLLGSLFDGGYVDEVQAFIAPIVIGGPAPGAVAGEGASRLADAWQLSEVSVERLGDDVLIRGYTGAWSPYNG